MDLDQSHIIHINVTDFAVAVATCKNSSLTDRPFVIAKEGSSRPIVISVSQRAREEGIWSGMSLAKAIRMVPSLAVIRPDASACAQADAELTKIASAYAPAFQADPGGHLFLDLTGTNRLFGPSVDCAVRIRNRIHDRLRMEITVAVASNKLVAKVGTRAIRPSGIAHVKWGDEASFLARQDIALLPGVGPSIGRILQVAGCSDIGHLATLDDLQVAALLGKRGIALRDAARGRDATRIDSRRIETRSISKRVDFAEPAFEEGAIRAAVISVAEDAGLEMRRELSACSHIRITLFWADGGVSEGSFRSRTPLVLDADVINGSWNAMCQAMTRRVRIRAFRLSLQAMTPAAREPDLFTPEEPTREERLQQAVDSARSRFGAGTLTHAAAVFHV